MAKSKKEHKPSITPTEEASFVGACTGMQGHIYDYKPGTFTGTDQYEKTTEMLINYCCSTLPESSALRYCCMELQLKTFPKPTMAASIPQSAAFPLHLGKTNWNSGRN